MGQKGVVPIPITLGNNVIALVKGGPTRVSQPLIPVGSCAKILTDSDPIQEYSLRPNFSNVMIRSIVVKPQGDPNLYSRGLLTTIPAPITSDPNLWFDFVAPGETTNIGTVGSLGMNPEYIYTKFEGGVYKPYMKLDGNYFDSLKTSGVSQIANGNFTVNLACYGTQVVQTLGVATTIVQQYVQTYKGTINCIFYGVMPLPGMFGSATIDDLTVEGVIESVSLTPPGYLQLSIAQYTGIQWSNPYLNILAE